jgi:hypothetical protein
MLAAFRIYYKKRRDHETLKLNERLSKRETRVNWGLIIIIIEEVDELKNEKALMVGHVVINDS